MSGKNKLDLSSVQIESLRAALAKVSLSADDQKKKKKRDDLTGAIQARLDILRRVDVKTRVCEPYFSVTIAGRVECSADLDFLVRFRVQKKMAVFENLHLVLDLRGLWCEGDVSGFFSAWALFVLTRCDRITVLQPSDAATRGLVYSVVDAVNESFLPVSVVDGDGGLSAFLPFPPFSSPQVLDGEVARGDEAPAPVSDRLAFEPAATVSQ